MGYGMVAAPKPKTAESMVLAAQEKAQSYCSSLTELERQALYQILNTEWRCRMPTSLHRELVDIAKREEKRG